MLQWFRELFNSSPDRYFEVEVTTDGFVSEARLPESVSDDFSHVLILEFEEPIRDGNPIHYLNLVDNGQVQDQFRMLTGETNFKLNLNPVSSSANFVFVDEDHNTYSNDEVVIREQRTLE